MLYLTIILFAVSALLGLILISKVFTNKSTPRPVVFAHGIFAAGGLGLLLYYVLSHAEKSPVSSLIVFLIAAVGGFVLFGNDFSKKPIPKSLALIHAAAAVAGFILLLIFTFSL